MRTSVRNILEESKSKLSGYTALLSYRLSNLCVKADPIALLSIEFKSDKETYGLEKLASSFQLDEYSFAVIPHDISVLGEIVKAVMKAHPEFKQEIKQFDESKNEEEEDNTYLCLTMPEVDENRRDILNDSTKALCESFKIVFDASYEKYSAKIREILLKAPKDEIKEAEDALKEIRDLLGKKAENYKEKKLGEIENAYQKYLGEQQESLKNKEEQEKAHSKRAGMSLRLMNDEDE